MRGGDKVNARQKDLATFLREYHQWKKRAKQINPSSTGISYDGMPKAPVPKEPNRQLDAHARAVNECWKRKKVINNLRDVGDQYAMLADILDWRYLHEYSTRKTQRLILEKYYWDMSDKTLRNKQKEALDEGLEIIPLLWLEEWQPLKK